MANTNPVVVYLVQNVGESDNDFITRVNLYIATENSYYTQVQGSYPPNPPTSPQYLGYPPKDVEWSNFWDVTNNQNRMVATMNYDNTYYIILTGSGSPIFPPTFAYPVIFQDYWDANTNTPALASGVGIKGHYYQVSVAGTTTLDGISAWGVDDWVVFNGTVWARVVNAQATETLTGKAEIATDAETQAGVDDSRIVTPLKLLNWWTWVKTQAQTITGLFTFVDRIRLKNLSASPNYVEIVSPAATGARTQTLQDATGTIALTSDLSAYVLKAGDTMTGLLQFSGTGHAGLQLNTLTTAQRNALTPAAGQIVFDTDLNVYCYYNGTFWQYQFQLNRSGANQTTTSASAQAITGFVTPTLEANSRYTFHGYLLLSCSATGGVKLGVSSVPAGATFYMSYSGNSSSAAAFTNQLLTAAGLGTANVVTQNTSRHIAVHGEISVGATPDTLQFQFASNTAGQTSTVFSIGSFIDFTKVS